MQAEPIINARFKKFRELYELTDLSDGEAFERFVNYVILTLHQPDAFTADSELMDFVSVGGHADMGIDGLAVKVNGLIVKSKQDIDDILKKFKRANVEFIFIQSKYKQNFNKGELNNFIDGVRDFVSDKHRFPMNDKIKNVLLLKEYLLSDEVAIMWAQNPQVTLYYVAMGRWRNAPDLVGLQNQFKADLSALNIFEEAELHFIDSEILKNLYDSIENNFTETINTRQIMPLTDVDGVSNSCMAVVFADELLKLLVTEEGNIRKSLFDDNVRDYQGENAVNSEIEETILRQPSKFILLNNGITIVCDDFKQNNTRLTIVNPQIVNGCQTGHVIFFSRKKSVDMSKVPLTIKFISTTNLDISNDIVRGTNRQNIVLEEAFETTKKFHKDLELFFNAVSPEYTQIYYERRSKQYAHNPTIKQTEKINLKILTQYFIAMFLNKPHIAHRHEWVLLRELPNEIYQEHHSKLPYFTTALAFYQLEKMFRENKLPKHVVPFKAHLLMMFRESTAGVIPNLNSEKKSDEHSQKTLGFLKNTSTTWQRFDELCTVFDMAREEWVNVLKRDKFRMKDVPEFTSLLLKKVRNRYPLESVDAVEESQDILKGKVIKTTMDKYGQPCGFISRRPDDVFFHRKHNKGLDFEDIVGKTVKYRMTTNPLNDKPMAIDVEISG